MRKKVVSVFLCAALGAGMLTGCGSAETSSKTETTKAAQAATTTEKAEVKETKAAEGKTGEVTTVEYMFWGSQDEINTIMATIDEFNNSHDEIQVKGIGMDPSVYLQKLSAYASSGTMPDIVQVAIDYGNTYNQKGIFEALDELLESNGVKDKVSDSLWGGCSYDGKIYAMPLQASAKMLVGNKTLFEEAGVEFPTESWTEDEFLAAVEKLTVPEKGQYGIFWGDAPVTEARALFGNGENEIYDRDNKKMNAVDNAALKHTWEVMVTGAMLENKTAPTVLSSKDVGGGFETGKYGMAVIGFWDIASFHKVVQDTFDWDLVPLPVSDEFGQWRTRIYANALSIAATSDNKEAAFEYLKWTLENREIQTKSVSLPVNQDIVNDPAFMTEFPEGSKVYNKQLAFDALNNGVAWQNTGAVAEINNNVIRPEIEKLMLKPDETSLDEVLQNIQTNGQAIFDAEK